RNIKITIAYDGTDYVGWQVQPNGPTIQAAIEKALKKLTGETRRVMGSGRTDSGVHAVGQVAAFQTESSIPARKFQRGLQTFLPDDIQIQSSCEVHELFHATHWAIRKHYRYIIGNAEQMSPFWRRYVHHFHGKLDLQHMQDACQYLLGQHDFRCFESHYPNRATSIRTIESATVTAHGDFLWFDVEADGFLYNMVRAIGGTLLKIGRGYWPPEMMKTIIDKQDRSIAGETAPPHGLYLMRVDYRSEPNSSDNAPTGHIKGHPTTQNASDGTNS
ncbi:UNVERIFIED_CONTAM: hypothetical protein GTU68_008724, partial [Idotea baltica]|nr:hypothetical protein [Idotea baltica]